MAEKVGQSLWPLPGGCEHSQLDIVSKRTGYKAPLSLLFPLLSHWFEESQFLELQYLIRFNEGVWY